MNVLKFLGFNYFFGTSGCSTAQPPYGFIEDDHFVEPPNVYRAERLWGSRRPGMTSKGWDDSEPDLIFTRKAVQYIEERSTGKQPFFCIFVLLHPTTHALMN